MPKIPRTHPSLAIAHCLLKKVVKPLRNPYFFLGICGGSIGLAYLCSEVQTALRFTQLSKIECFTKFWWYIPVGITAGIILAWLDKKLETRSSL